MQKNLQEVDRYLQYLEAKVIEQGATIVALEARILKGIADDKLKQGVLLDDLTSDEEVDGC